MQVNRRQKNRRQNIFVLSILLLACLVQPAPYSVQAACCYFAAKDKDINQPGQKAFISWNAKEKKEAFTVQPKFEGNAVDFGMVIPTPSRPKLDEMPRDFFKDLALYTILMPLPEPIYPAGAPLDDMARASGGKSLAMFGLQEKRSVHVLESGVVGSLDYKIIVADDANGLFDWLKQNKYSYGGDQSTLDFYIKKKWFFTVMKIDPKQMKHSANGSYTGEVTPTRFAFASPECVYPLKITQLSVKDKTDALFYVQSAAQMDLQGDWSWMPSYRSMYLTYMLGCGASPTQQQELQSRTQWLDARRKNDPQFETTKLEWAKKLSDAEMSVLDDPKKNYAQMGTGDLPPGAKVIALKDFLAAVKQEFLKSNNQKLPDYAKQQLTAMEDQYQPGKGMIVKYDDKSVGNAYIQTAYAWYPARDVPGDEIKGLPLLKGHLQKGQWLTKFRKVVRRSEMTHDIVLAAVPGPEEQSYTRIMPTSPP